MIDFKKLSQNQFLNRFIVFEDDEYIKNWLREIKMFIGAIPSNEIDKFINKIGEIKSIQKLENAPFALLALCPSTERRREVIDESLRTIENAIALIKWIGTFGTINTFDAADRTGITDIVQYLEWPDNIPIIFDKDDPFEVMIEKTLKAVKKRQEETKVQLNPWGEPIEPLSLGDDIPEEKIHEMSMIDILSKVRECYHIGIDSLINIIRGKSLDAGYIQPICYLESIILLSTHLSRRQADDLTKYNDALSALLEHQLSSLRKLNDTAIFMIDNSGSMDQQVTYNNHTYISRKDIAILWALVFSKLCKNVRVYLTAAANSSVISTTLKHIELPFNIREAIALIDEVDIGCQGIYTHAALEKVQNDLSALKINARLCLVFADSEDMTPSRMRFPLVPAIRVAEKQVLVNAEHRSKIIETNNQWDAEIKGYSNFVIEYAYDLLDIANPTSKSSDFNGSNYRVSF